MLNHLDIPEAPLLLPQNQSIKESEILNAARCVAKFFGHDLCTYCRKHVKRGWSCCHSGCCPYFHFCWQADLPAFPVPNSCCKDIFVDSAGNSNLGHRLLWRPKFIINICTKHNTEQNSVNKFAKLFALYKSRKLFYIWNPVFLDCPITRTFSQTPSYPKNHSVTAFALSHLPHKQLRWPTGPQLILP